MKKKILAITMGFLLIGVNAYAAGDLKVTGNLGVGVSNPTMKIHVEKGNPTYTAPDTLIGGGIQEAGGTEKNIAAGYYFSQFDNTSALSNSMQIGIDAFSRWNGQADFTKEKAVVGGVYQAVAEPNSFNLTLSDLLGVEGFTGAYDFNGNASISNAYSIYAGGHTQSMTGKTTTNAYDFYGKAHIVSKGVITNAYGIYLEKQTGGTNNYGIVLDGDGAGSDLVLGASQEVKLYGSAGDLIIDTSGDVGIGTTNPMGKLDVNGSIYQRGSQLHADYVFEPGYKLESIEEHAKYMWNNKHLKAIPKATVDESGQEVVEVGSHRRGIVEELEKAHIYIEQLHKQIKELEERLAKLEEGLEAEK